MTNSTDPNPDRETEINSNRRVWLLWLSRSGLAFGVILLVGIAAGAWWAWNFVQTELAPIVEKNLTQSLKRPVRLGKVEGFSLTGLRLGASEIPATPTDTDRATVAAVDVKFDLLRLLLERTLALNVTLVNPNLYLEEDPDGRWVTTEIAPEEPGAAFKTEVESIRLQNGNIVLVPQPKTGNPKVPIGVATANGQVELRDNNQRFRFELAGQIASGGNLNLQGEYLRPTQQLNLEKLQAQQVQAADVDRLLKLPINLLAGRVDASLQVKYNPTQPLSLLGTARLQDVTAGLPQQPIPFAGTNGTLLFQDQVIKLQNVSSLFGQIPLLANGGLDLQQGYDLSAKVLNTEIAKITQTFNFKPPVPLNGEVQAEVKLTGAIAQPLLIGQFATTKPTLVDKVNFNTVSARFALDARQGELVIANLQAKPEVGGEVTGKGQVKLGTTGGIVFDLQADKVPGDAIAKLYNANLPPGIAIGPVRAQTQVFGPYNDLRTVARWQAPQATYPGNGEVVLARGQTILRDTTLRVAGGTLQAAAKIANGRWDALVEGSQLPVGSLLDLQAQVGEGDAGTRGHGDAGRSGGSGQQQIPPAIGKGIFTGRARLGGKLGSLQAQDIQVVAQGRLQVAGGTLQIQQAQLSQGNWDALVAATSVQLTSLLTPEQLKNLPVQPGAFTGRVRAAGNLASSEAKDIRAVASGSLNLAGGTVQIQQAALNQGNWEALVDATNVQLTQLLSPEQVKNLPVQPGAFTGRVRAAGNLASSEPKDIKAAVQGSLNIAGKTVQIQQAALSGGNWQAAIAATNVQLTQLLTPDQVKNLPVQPGAFTGRVRAAGNLESSQAKDIRAVASGSLNVAGGTVQIQQAGINQGNWEALVDATNVQLTRLLTPEQVKNLPVKPEAFTGRVRVAGNLESTQARDIRAVASGRLFVAGGTIQIQQAQLSQGNWEALVAASGVSLASLPQVPPQFQQGRFNGQFRLAGNLESTDLENIRALGNGNVQIAGGNLQIRQAALANNRWQAVVAASGLQLARLLPPEQARNLPIQQGRITGEARLEGSLDTINLSNIQAVARGSLQTGNGNLQIRQAQLNEGRWQAVVDAAGVQLNRLPQAPPQLQAIFSGQVQAAGSLESFQPKDIQASASGRLQVAGGNIQIQQAQLNQGRWQANINAAGVELSRFAQLPNNLPAIFSGQVQAAGSLESFQPKDIQASARGSLNIAGGSVQIQQASLEQGRWQTAFEQSIIQI
jgi:translocation and assembly module TamB